MHYRVVVAIVVFFAGAIAFPQPAEACSCPTATPIAGFPATGGVFHGRALRTDQFGQETVRTLFEVYSVWHGSIDAEVSVTHPSTDRSSCGIDFAADEAYLIYASDLNDGHLLTGACSGNYRISANEIAERFPLLGPGTPVASNAPVPDVAPEVAASEQSEERDDGWLLIASVALLVFAVLSAGLLLARRRSR
jgi:hypothetical protein